MGVYTYTFTQVPVDPGDPPGTNIQAMTYEQLNTPPDPAVTWLAGPTLTEEPWDVVQFSVEAETGQVMQFQRRAQDTAGLWSEWEYVTATLGGGGLTARSPGIALSMGVGI